MHSQAELQARETDRCIRKETASKSQSLHLIPFVTVDSRALLNPQKGEGCELEAHSPLRLWSQGYFPPKKEAASTESLGADRKNTEMLEIAPHTT